MVHGKGLAAALMQGTLFKAFKKEKLDISAMGS